MPTYTAVAEHNAPWWIGWVVEVAGVNAQAATRAELIDDLRSALAEAVEMTWADAFTIATTPPGPSARR